MAGLIRVRRWAVSGAVSALVLLVGACHQEPSFDERYDAASQSIQDRAREIDARIAGASGTPSAEGSVAEKGAR
ncbi:hypothetical protein HT136_11730 [Novosphingobium profundi]|uniref:hypothetical protein n=1 Tax=Novosphingobium profundi TaxID=1774954 RepID=UPI001BDAAD33|nr:hypothetical protein [Novosphingobium profundi]MBT0669033.1 hypothetical protein [Novosphingobium profundi]